VNPLGVIAAIGGVGALLMAFRQARRTRPPGGLPTAADGELGRANAAAARAMSVLRQENRAMAQQSRVKSVVPQGGTAFLVTIATPTGEIDVLSDLGIGGAGQKVVAFRSNGMALEADGTVRPMRR
jgi:hypothetical protein